eukprot:PhF_6_TR42350/c0_g1_i1/m.63892
MESINEKLAVREAVERALRNNDITTLLSKYKYIRYKPPGATTCEIAPLLGVSPDKKSIVISAQGATVTVTSLQNQRATKEEVDRFQGNPTTANTLQQTTSIPSVETQRQPQQQVFRFSDPTLSASQAAVDMSQVTTLRSEMETLRQKLANSEKENNALKTQLEDKEYEFFRISDDIAQLNEKIQSHEATNRTSELKIESLRTEKIQSHEATNRTSELKIESLRTE